MILVVIIGLSFLFGSLWPTVSELYVCTVTRKVFLIRENFAQELINYE